MTIPDQTCDQIAYVAHRMGISASALLSQILFQPVQDLYSLVKATPRRPTQDEAIRLRGASASIVQQRVQEALDALEHGKG